MTAAITDLLKKTYNAANPNVARVTATRAISGTTLTCDNLAGWPTDTAVDFSTYKIDALNKVLPGTQIDWKGLVAGNNIGTLTRITGASDGGSAIGDVVEMNPTANWANDVVTNILTHANQDGTLKTDAATTVAIKDANVTTAKIADAAITNAKLSTVAGEIGAAWQSWTPMFTNFTLGNGNVVAKYIKVGRTVHFRFVLTLGSTSVMGTNPIPSLPLTAAAYGSTASGQTRIGLCNYERNGVTNYAGVVILGSTTGFYIPMLIPNGGVISTSTITPTFPFTPVAGDEITAEGTYETAA